MQEKKLAWLGSYTQSAAGVSSCANPSPKLEKNSIFDATDGPTWSRGFVVARHAVAITVYVCLQPRYAALRCLDSL